MICPHCGKGLLKPKLTSSPVLIIKETPTQSELDSDTVFVLKGKNKNGYEENTTSYYLHREMGLVGLQMMSFNLTNFYMHIPPKSGRSNEEKELAQRCIDFSIQELVKLAEGKKIILIMGAETIRTFTGYNSSDTYGLIMKSKLLPDVPVIIPCPNSDKMMNQPIGEFRNSLKVLAEQIQILKQYEGVK
jgi:hypothetical protein